MEVELHERVAVPKPVRLLGLIDPQLSPLGTTSVSDTVPEKPFRPDTLIVDVKEEPTLPEVEVAEMMKSVKLKVAVVEWLSKPLVLVIVRA